MTTNFYSVEMEPNIKIGDRVLVKGKWEGFVRWIGETEFKASLSSFQLAPLNDKDHFFNIYIFFLKKRREGGKEIFL